MRPWHSKLPSFRKRPNLKTDITIKQELNTEPKIRPLLLRKKIRDSSSKSLHNDQTRNSTRKVVSGALRHLFPRSLSSPASFDKHGDAGTVDLHDDFQRLMRHAKELDNKGNELFEAGYYREALSSYSKSLRLKRENLKIGYLVDRPDLKNNLLTSVATSINNIGYLRQHLGSTTRDEIMKAYEDSLQIKKKILGDNDLSVGKTLNNIGSVFFGNNAYEEAIKAYQQSLEIMISNLGIQHLDTATIHSNIGKVHSVTGKLEEAKLSYHRALEIRWLQLGEKHPKVIRLLEKIADIEMNDASRKLEEGTLVTRLNNEDYYTYDWDLNNLRISLEKDVIYLEEAQRKLSLEMFRDKIELICEMRAFGEGEI